MHILRIRERLKILREFLYSGVSLNRRLDLVDAKLRLLLDETVNPARLANNPAPIPPNLFG